MSERLVAEPGAWGWKLVGDGRADVGLLNEYLAYLSDRSYSPATVRAYAFDLLHFARWLDDEGIALLAVVTDTLLRYLSACRSALLPGQYDNVVLYAHGGRQASPRRP